MNCYNIGKVTEEFDGKSSGGPAGGILASGSEVINCFNSGDIIVNKSVAGGISATNVQNAENCYNTGNVKGAVASGIIGYGSSQKLYKCYNTGNISAKTAPTGGILGVGYGDATCTECYNIGNIENKSPDLLGEIAPVSFGTTINCAFLQKETNAPANGATPKSKEEMDKIMDMQKFVDLLNQKVQEYNNNPENTTKLKSWKLENGKPVFAE